MVVCSGTTIVEIGASVSIVAGVVSFISFFVVTLMVLVTFAGKGF